MPNRFINVFAALSVFMTACAVLPKKTSRFHKGEFAQLKKKISELEDENAILRSREVVQDSSRVQTESKTVKSHAKTTQDLVELRSRVEELYEQKKFGEILSATFSLSPVDLTNKESRVQLYSIRFIRAMSLQKIGLNDQAEEIFKSLAALHFPSISKLAEEQLRNSVFLKRKVSKTGASGR